MKEYKIGYNMYNMIKEEKDTKGPWQNFMKYVKDENTEVIVVLAGRDHMKVIFAPDEPDQIKEVIISNQ
jgi:hypothetical protein